MVLIILGLIFGGLFIPITMQMEQRNISETRTTIENIKEALIGYAMANGRFPCPAAAPGAGVTAVESIGAGGIANGVCNNFLNGFVPGVTLGLTPTNNAGYVLDAWNNPIRYSISNISDDGGATNIFTKTTGIKNANSAACPNCGMPWISGQNLLFICNATPTAVAGAAAVDCTAGAVAGTVALTSNAVIVIYSLGKNWATGGAGNDEAANLNGDPVYVTHEPTPVGAANGEFDDLVTWISPNTIFNRMVQAGQLP